MNNKVVELFGYSIFNNYVNWQQVISSQGCTFRSGLPCYKTRKSDSSNAIGSCTVLFGQDARPLAICPSRMLQHGQIFIDCIHLLANHRPGNDLHVIPEVSIPGGRIDYFLVSTQNGILQDFVGIEIQTLDTIGSVWPERQRLLRELGVGRMDDSENSSKAFGINWKMSAKTILMQIHHKIRTFEHVGKKLVLVIQDDLLDYMAHGFKFSHLHTPAIFSDSMHFHAYSLNKQFDNSLKMNLCTTLSTDEIGIAECIGLQAEARLELDMMVSTLQSKLSQFTFFVKD